MGPKYLPSPYSEGYQQSRHRYRQHTSGKAERTRMGQSRHRRRPTTRHRAPAVTQELLVGLVVPVIVATLGVALGVAL
eukprot:14174715-Heterocapsa_arctica.AAC.1